MPLANNLCFSNALDVSSGVTAGARSFEGILTVICSASTIREWDEQLRSCSSVIASGSHTFRIVLMSIKASSCSGGSRSWRNRYPVDVRIDIFIMYLVEERLTYTLLLYGSSAVREVQCVYQSKIQVGGRSMS